MAVLVFFPFFFFSPDQHYFNEQMQLKLKKLLFEKKNGMNMNEFHEYDL